MLFFFLKKEKINKVTVNADICSWKKNDSKQLKYSGWLKENCKANTNDTKRDFFNVINLQLEEKQNKTNTSLLNTEGRLREKGLIQHSEGYHFTTECQKTLDESENKVQSV